MSWVPLPKNDVKTNFEISDNIALTYGSQYFDLHNEFELEKFEQNDFENSLKLYWKKCFGNLKTEPIRIVLCHNVINHFVILNSNENIEDKSLNEITFFPSSERENIESFTERAKPNQDDDILYFFEFGKILRINCEFIELKIL